MAIDRMVFGMHDLNITQAGAKATGKTSYSHPSYELDLAGSDSGIDYWYNKMPNTSWYCAGSFGTKSTGNTRFFWSVDSSGNAKKVLCADGQERLITLAMTHSGKNYQVGKIYGCNEVLYQEGTAGKATGNHIHLEVCAGHVKTKVKNSYGYYNLANMLDPRNVFFILDGYTTVRSTAGLTFKHTDTVEVNEMTFNNGLNSFSYAGQTIYVAKGYGKFKQLHMLTADAYDKVNDITYYDGGTALTVLARANCNYFQMASGQTDPVGQHYGVEDGDTSYHQEPKQAAWLVFYQLNDGTCDYCTSDNYWYGPDDVIFACSPYSVLRHNGKDVYARSEACGNKDGTKNQQTAYFLIDDYWCIAVCAGKLTPAQMGEFCKSLGNVKELFLVDSGGSSQMVYNGRKVVYTGRHIPDVLALAYVNSTEDNKSEASNTAEEDGSSDDSKDKQIEALTKENTELKAANADLIKQLNEQKQLTEENLAVAKANESKAEKYTRIEKIVKE